MTTAPSRKSFLEWLNDRYHLAALLDFVRHKEVPLGSHPMIWYYLGGTTLFFFMVQIVSGVLLLMYYQPGEDTSYESIRFITTKVPFGWLVRSVHCWSAHLMIISLSVHMFSTMLLKAYRPPRELTWVTGFVLFAVTLTFGFSGYLLPWNELAFFATVVGTDSVKAVPVVGDWILQVMRGGEDVTMNTLYRFFALHVVILPLVIFGIVGLHVLLIQRQGMAAPLGETRSARGMPFFPNFFLRDILLWLLCLIALASLAVAWPYGAGIPGVEWELGQKADPLAPAYPGIKPEWYFLWIYQLLKEFPPHLLGMEGPQAALLLVAVILGIWATLPWLDRRAARNQSSLGFTDFGFGGILFVLFLTLKAWDVGAGPLEANELPDEASVARVSAAWTLAVAALMTAIRMRWYRHRWFVFTGAVALQVVLNGFLGVSYLMAGSIAIALAGAVLVVLVARDRAASSLEGRGT